MHHYTLACNVLWDIDLKIGVYNSFIDIIEAGHGKLVSDHMRGYIRDLYPKATYEDFTEVNKQFRNILNRRKYIRNAPSTLRRTQENMNMTIEYEIVTPAVSNPNLPRKEYDKTVPPYVDNVRTSIHYEWKIPYIINPN